MATYELSVTGMTCGHCAAAVEKSLRAVDGVREAKVDHEAGRACVQIGEGAAGAAPLVEAVRQAGFDVSGFRRVE